MLDNPLGLDYKTFKVLHSSAYYCQTILDDNSSSALIILGFVIMSPLIVVSMALYCSLARRLHLFLCFQPCARAVYKGVKWQWNGATKSRLGSELTSPCNLVIFSGGGAPRKSIDSSLCSGVAGLRGLPGFQDSSAQRGGAEAVSPSVWWGEMTLHSHLIHFTSSCDDFKSVRRRGENASLSQTGQHFDSEVSLRLPQMENIQGGSVHSFTEKYLGTWPFCLFEW
ncbi:Transmembrane protein 88, partial [Ophiophagus hannah]